MRHYLDYNNREIKVGDRVAFNASGNVHSGVVQYITRGGVFKILPDQPAPWRRNPLAQVKSERGVLVISRGAE